jgi:hypothetical protein
VASLASRAQDAVAALRRSPVGHGGWAERAIEVVNMKLKLESSEFGERQAIFIAEIVERIKIKLQEAGVGQDKLEDLTASIALSIAGVIDDLAPIEVDGVEVHPYLTFRTEDDELLHCGENAYTHEQVYRAMKRAFGF